MLKNDFRCVSEWLYSNKLTLNISKTKCMLYGTKNMISHSRSLSLEHAGSQIEQVTEFKYLGVTFDQFLSFNIHINDLVKKVASRIVLVSYRKNPMGNGGPK